ncbi:MAG: hypothetical protein C4532_01445 [Candidatus Abyssobacteria bacterium SURF_17]|uniref:Uncharacterized protein n=1 Tax=Candidatus Abyssobacteria bacterium SURF_17 TaxID=2093361 RepID=A0A419F8M7_9BACT|nr:MAG: hypothetical protein C4532_01445 [Candidatus Abyssubacteria bacterium SURF_17]
MWLVFGLSVFTPCALLAAWIFLIIRKRRSLGAGTSEYQPIRVRDAFGLGLATIRRHRWIVLLPVLGRCVSFAASFPATYLAVKSDPQRFIEPAIAGPYGLSDAVIPFGSMLLSSLASALRQIDSAMLSPFHSRLIAGICFLGAAYLLLRRRRSDTAATIVPALTGRRKMLVGILFAGAGIACIVVFAALEGRVARRQFFWPWLWIVIMLLLLPVASFANATILSLMKAGLKKEEISFTQAIPEAESCFIPLLGFAFVSAFIGSSGFLPLIALPTGRTLNFVAGSVLPVVSVFLTMLITGVLAAMVSFVPAIIVDQRAPLISAFKRCLELWARHPRSAAAFVLASTGLLLIPEMLGQVEQWLYFPLGWTRAVFSFACSCLQIALGVLVMCSMIAFHRGIVAWQRPQDSPASSGDA